MSAAALFLLLLAPTPEVRGLWVVRTGLTSPQMIDRVVSEAVEGGFNSLFVQVRGRGDSFYDSRIVRRSPLLAGQPVDFDPLAHLISEAHAHHLAVHAWVNVLLVGDFLPLPQGHIVLEHPGWLMVPKAAARLALASPHDTQSLVRQVARYDNEVEGYYLSPSAPGVPDYLEAVVREVVQDYAVEGLHLDFIRYPGPSYDYSLPALKGFHPEPGDALEAALANPTLYGDYLRGKLTSLADRLARAARAGRPGIQVSAAVVADEALAVSQRYQDWPQWLARGILDALCPMAYTPDTRLFRAQVVQARSRVSMGQALWAGVGAYRLSLGEIVEKIQVARDVGVSGVILFSHESLTPSQWRALQVQVFPSGSLSLGHAQP